ncbi:MAG: S8 family serine peptidase [Verrucomicrobiia bacterium]
MNSLEFNGKAGVDDDGNEYIDDIYGWNAVNDNGTIYDPTSDDHGTHVAGTIGAEGNNGLGVVGMNWNVQLIVGKFLGSSGGTTADAIQAIDYMTNLKKNKEVNIVALNNSWGGGGYDSLLLAAIQRAASENILFVAAAGNSRVNTDRRPYYPACYSVDSIISVAAIDRVGALASFSNYGAKTVDLGAPGVAILSTLPGGTYGAYDGTSMATPHVTGAAALFAAANPGASIATIKNAIMTSALATTSLAGKTVTGGRLNVSGFTGGPVPSGPPAAPSGLIAVASSEVCKITLTWTDNSDDETSFIIVQTCDGEDTYIPVSPKDGKGSTVSYEDTWLQPNTVYGYKVAARNSYGTSAYSASVSATTADVKPSASASYIKTDTETAGNWCIAYGDSGYGHLPFGEPTYFFTPYTYPSGVTVECFDRSIFEWTEAFADQYARLRKDCSMTETWLGCYYSSPSFTLDLDTGTTPYQVAFYVVDGYPYDRSQTIEVLDVYGQIPIKGTLQTVTSFTGGKYFVYNIKGHVLVRFTCTAGKDAVLSGIFFDLPDTSVPSVSITEPSNGAVVSGTVTIKATANDDNAVAKVDFYVGETLVGTDYTATDGWSISWNSTEVDNAVYDLSAVATDTAGNWTTSGTVTVTVENVPEASVEVHCGDLDGTKTVTGRRWSATVIATIHDAAENLVSGATVTGTWSGGLIGTVSGQTLANGTVSFKTGSMTGTSVTFTIDDVAGTNMEYVGANNHDEEDGDESDGTSIMVLK